VVLNFGEGIVKVKVMLRPTVSRPVCLGTKHPFGACDQIFITCVTVTVLFLWGALSDERSGLSFVLPAHSFSGPSPLGLETIFYCLTFETSLFVASYDSQGHGGGIRLCLYFFYISRTVRYLNFCTGCTVALPKNKPIIR
jgi:hypothetical protein